LFVRSYTLEVTVLDLIRVKARRSTTSCWQVV
jgi:hypothetical protein